MPDVTVNVKVAGAQQVASQLQPVSTALSTVGNNATTATTGLNSVGSSMTTAGTKATTAGGRFEGVGTKIAGMTASLGLLTAGIFSLENSFDKVTKANLAAERSVTKSKDSNDAAKKALDKYNDALKQTGSATDEMAKKNNAAAAAAQNIETAERNILVLQEQKRAALKLAGNDMAARIIIEEDFNKAIDANKQVITDSNAVIKDRDKAVKEGTPSQKELNTLLDDYKDKQNKANTATETAAFKTQEAKEAQVEFYAALVPNLATIGGSAASLLSFAKGVKSAGDGMGGAATKGSSFLKVIGPLGLAIAAAAAAFLAIKTNAFGFRDFLNDLGEAIGKAVPALKPLLELIKGIGAALGLAPDIKDWKSTVKTALDEIKTAVSGFADIARQKIGEVVDTIGQFTKKLHEGDIGGAFDILAQSATKAFNDIKNAIMAVDWAGVWQSFQDAFASSLEWIKNTGSNLGRDLGVIVKNWDWNDAWTSFKDAFTSSVNFLGQNIGAPLAQLGKIIYDFVAENGPQWWQSFKDAFNSSLQFLSQNVGPALAFLGSAISAYVIENAPSWWKSIQEGFSAALQFLGENVGPALTTVGTALYNYVVENAPSWWKSIQEGFSTALQTLSENIGPALQTVGTAIINYIVENAPGWFTGLGQAVISAFSNIDQETITTGLQTLGRAIIQALQDYITGAGDTIIAAFINGITTAIQTAPEGLATIAGAIVNGIISAPNAILALGQGVVSWFTSALSEPETAEALAAGAGQAATDWIGAFGQWMLENFPQSFAASFQLQETIKESITNFANAVGAFFLTEIPKAFADAGKTIVAAIVHGITVSLPESAQAILGQGAQIAAKIVEGLGEIGSDMLNKITSGLSAAVRNAGQTLQGIGQQIANAIMGGLGGLGSMLGLGGPQVQQQSYGGGGYQPFRQFAKGFGPAVIDKPTRILVGEAGPEMVSVIPMKGRRRWNTPGSMTAANGMGQQYQFGQNYGYTGQGLWQTDAEEEAYKREVQAAMQQGSQQGTSQGTQQGMDQSMGGMQQAVQQGAQQGVQDGMQQAGGGGGGGGGYPMAPSNTEIFGAGRFTWGGGAAGTQLGAPGGGGAQYPMAPSDTSLFGTGTRFTWTGGKMGTQLGQAAANGFSNSLDTNRLGEQIGAAAGRGLGTSITVTGGLRPGQSGGTPSGQFPGMGGAGGSLAGGAGRTPSVYTGQVPASYGKPLGQLINGIAATILPGQGPIRQAALGMHERLKKDTMIQAHKNEYVDIGAKGPSDHPGKSSGLDTAAMNKITDLLERLITQGQTFKVDFNVDGRKLSSVASKNMGTAGYGDK
jgi:hypothetical protein